MALRSRGSALAVACIVATTLVWPSQARAAALYDSMWVGESAFRTLAPGDTTDLTVFFQNSGTATWTVGASTQVDLAACLDDKTTCDIAPAVAAWNPGGSSAWRSATRYATHAQPSVPPGATGNFTYTVKVPASATVGTYRFGGDLVVSATGAKVHAEGYYHEVKVNVPPPVVTKPTVVSAASASVSQTLVTFSANMSCGSLVGGTYVIKDSAGTVVNTTTSATSSNQITAATNSSSGSGAMDCKTVTLYTRESTSNLLARGATYTLQVTGVTDANGTAIDTAANTVTFVVGDSTAPTATAFTYLSPSLLRVYFSESMTSGGGTGVGNVANYRLDGTYGASAFTACIAVAGALAADCTLATAYTATNNGSHTLAVSEVTDVSGNLISPNPTLITATYPPPSARPTIKSAVSSSVTQVVVTFDRPMNTAAAGTGCANPANYSTTKADGTASGLTLGVTCASNQATLALTGATSGTGYNVVVTGVTELFGNVIDPTPASASFTAAADTARPTVLSVSTPTQMLSCDVGSPAPCGRSQFTVTFSEPMTQGSATGGVANAAAYVLKDAAGTSFTISSCTSVSARNVATTGAVTCALMRPVPAGTYTLTIGSTTPPTDIAGTALASTALTLTFP